MKQIITSLIIIFLWTNCSTAKYEPERIKGIPKDAFWIGGEDGGQWYKIKKFNEESLTADFVIYNDYTGEITTERQFRLKCNSRADIKWDNLKDEINAYDGQRIILKTIGINDKHCYFE